jgi:lysozyme family protein
MRLKNLHTKAEWSLALQLFRLEAYNGFGYRFRGLASPYLWSFSDRYERGKFVRDGVFDPNAVSRQSGAAVLVKRLIARGDIQRP